MLGRRLAILRRRIALKLTLTLVGFVAVALLSGGLYLHTALRGFAVEALEARLATAARLLRNQAGEGLASAAAGAAVHEFVLRAAEATGARFGRLWPAGSAATSGGARPSGPSCSTWPCRSARARSAV